MRALGFGLQDMKNNSDLLAFVRVVYTLTFCCMFAFLDTLNKLTFSCVFCCVVRLYSLKKQETTDLNKSVHTGTPFKAIINW